MGIQEHVTLQAPQSQNKKSTWFLQILEFVIDLHCKSLLGIKEKCNEKSSQCNKDLEFDSKVEPK